MSEESVIGLLEGTEDPRIKALFVFMLATGVRLGEALGLKWTEVDFDLKEVWIRQASRKTRLKRLFSVV
jgi:integrase